MVTCVNGFVVGSAYRYDVDEGMDEGSAIKGWPVAMRPKSGPDMALIELLVDK